jgi:tetratricopeptide (TPR) repeat protein
MDELIEHPDRETLAAYSRGELSAAEGTRIERHLRSGCAICQPRVDELLLDIEQMLQVGAPFATPAVDAGWNRLFARLEFRMAQARLERAAAPALAFELLRMPAAGRDEALRSDLRFRTLALCDHLLEQSFEQGFSDPARAIELAQTAVRLADFLEMDTYGQTVVQDVRARSWGHLGNARRVASDLAGADQALTIAESFLVEGSGDPLEEARLLDFKASLLSDRGWFEDAADLLEMVIDIYEEIRDFHRQGRALISKGVFLGYAGRPEEAVELIPRGLARIDREQEPRLVLMSRHNLAWFLNDCGRPDDAAKLLDSFRDHYQEFPDSWTQLRLRWLESRIALNLGRQEEAEAGFREARERSLADGLCYDTSMLTLDLAALYLREGRTDEVKNLAREMLPIFVSQDVHRQALAALAIFQQAAEMERATPRLVREVANYLTRARRNPGLRFRGTA